MSKSFLCNGLNKSIVSQIFEKEVGKLLSEGELIFYEHADIGSPLAFLLNKKLLFHNTCQTHTQVWDLVNPSDLLKQHFPNCCKNR